MKTSRVTRSLELLVSGNCEKRANAVFNIPMAHQLSVDTRFCFCFFVFVFVLVIQGSAGKL